MELNVQPVEKLRQYLRELPPVSRSLLIAELERALLRGEEVTGGAMVLQEVRQAVREASHRVPRIGNPARLFFRRLEPFLTSATLARKTPGRIARNALEPLWSWMTRDLAPTEAQRYIDGVSGALANGTPTDALVDAFQIEIIDGIQGALAAANVDEKALRRLAAQVGTPSALDDSRDLLAILSARNVLSLIDSRLPVHIRDLAQDQLEDIKALLDSPLVTERQLLPYAVVLVLGRLAVPWQLIRLAVDAAKSDDAARIAATPYALAVTIALDDVEAMVDELRSDLKRGVPAVAALLKCIHDAARGLRTELDLSADSPWARQLAGIRSDVSDLLHTEIESAPGRVRRLLRSRPSNEIARNSVLNADDVTETEALIEFVGACRNFAGELAISEVTLRTFQEIQQYLDARTRTLLDALRGAGEPDHSFCKSQVDAAVRFCAKVFGNDYASLLSKAAELAANPERRAVAKA